jgi:cysteine desulfurase
MTQMGRVHPWVYLDNNATTRVDARVLDTMLPLFREHFANPSSEHSLGASAAEALHIARRQVQSLIGAASSKEIVFTSGGSESNNTAILSALETCKDRDEVIISAVEHPSILAVCDHLQRTGRARVHRIPVDRDGRLDEEAYRSALSARTALVSMQWANNETGTLFPVERLAAMATAEGALFR